jgi:atypical dual specificity phosphatase
VPERFHWIIPGKLAAMALPGIAAPLAADLAAIEKLGVSAIATLTEKSLDPRAIAASKLDVRHFPIVDFDVPTIEQTQEFCLWVDERIAAGAAVAVHCFAGLGRTGTMIGCWLVRDPAKTTERVLFSIRKIEPGFVQTAEQEAFIAVWESRVKNL